jgi:flagellar hook-length control protein FliK
VQSASAPTTPYVDPQSVIEQVVTGIVLRNSGTTSEVRMRLQPEHLGDVSLKLTVSGNTISANIVAQNADVRDMLLSNQQQLARTLADAGLSLGNFSVDVSGGNPGFSQQQTPQHRSLFKVGALHADAASEDDSWADSRFGPPVVAGSKSLVLNYLA